MKKTLQHIIALTALLFTSTGSLFAQSPIYLSSVVENISPAILEMTYSLSLANIVPATSSFDVQVNSGPRVVDLVLISGTKVILSLASPIIYDDIITISYTRPDANWLQGSTGAPVQSITAQSVINNCQPAIPNAVTDADGNIYNAVSIGSQIWITENLKVTHFRNGDEIPNIQTSTVWSNSSSPAYCWYTNNPSNKDTYGALYNWYTVETGNLCPNGWHTPSFNEWETLRAYLGGINEAGGPLKQAGFAHWTSPNTGATNESGFTALGGGNRAYTGEFMNFSTDGHWWASTEYDANDGWSAYMLHDYSWLGEFRGPYKYGFSVRCLQGSIEQATVTTVSVSNITLNSAQIYGNVNSDGGNAVMARGICWSEAPNPTYFDNRENASGDLGTFSSTITGLTPNTNYYVRAYAKNLGGIAYGDELTFPTKSDIPTVTTTAISNIKPVSALGGGEVISNGGASLSARGLCWSESKNPTTADSQTWEGSSTGSFTSFVINLKSNTTYYVKAYATNSFGTGYGNQVSFTTTSAFDPIIFNPGLTYGTVADNDGNNYRTIPIGNQVWMAENLKTTKFNDSNPIPLVEDVGNWIILTTPGYCWYDNNEALFKDTYGALYNWYVVSTGKLCPTGWHVPTDAEWTTFTNYFGGENVAGGKLKETSLSHWYSPNTGATNETGFTALPGGLREMPHGNFGFVGRFGNYWPGDEGGSSLAWNRTFNFDLIYVYRSGSDKRDGYSVRCVNNVLLPTVSTSIVANLTPISAFSGGNIISDGGGNIQRVGIVWSTEQNPEITDNRKDYQYDGNPVFTASATNLDPLTTYYIRAYAINDAGVGYGDQVVFTTTGNFADIEFNPNLTYGSVSDIDGHLYKTIKIGQQNWMAENLKTTKFNDGTAIPLVEDDNSLWSTLKTPAYSWYKNQEATYKNTFGALYNWYTVITGNLCPTGWHVPTFQEFNILQSVYGGGGSSKETGLTHWVYPNQAATNASGFTALPAGVRSASLSTIQFNSIGTAGLFWKSSERDGPNGLSKPHDYALTVIMNNSDETGQLIMWNFFLPKSDGQSVRCIKNKDIIYVTNVNDNGEGSLRAAIEEANTDGNTDIINFNIPGKGPFVIKPSSGNPLPTLVNPVIIDGFSQSGASPSTSTMLIELDGSIAGISDGLPINGLTINNNQCTVKGLVITGFTGNGIKIIGSSNFRTGNRISANSIFNNVSLGIDLGGNGVTANDENSTPAPDDDFGPNGYQNYPVLDKIVFSLGNVYIEGHLKSMPDQVYILEFFASKLADNTGFGEGQTYLGSAIVTTDASGNAIFTDKTFPYQTIYGDVLTATATDPYGNTSEFSKAIGGLPDQEHNTNSFNYFINPNGLTNTDGTSKDTIQILKAVNNAFTTWTDIPTSSFAFNFQDETKEKYAHIDGRNLVSFTDDEYLFGDGVLAITAKTLKLGASDTETKILDADIIFNPYYVKHKVWNFGIADDMANTGFFDIQSITTHEIGHILGLLHSGVHNSTMWFEIGQGIDARSLEQDDRSWASYKYPKPGNNFGSISGNIKYGYDDTKPIAGAIVLAINTATRDTVHSYSDVNGNYLVPGLSAGSYNVYIEPLDGDVYGRPLYPRNISLYIYCNTTNIDYPGEFYSGTIESAAEAQDVMSAVTVNSGAVTLDINFMTNRDITPPSVVSVTPPDLSISQDIGIKFSEPVDMGTVKKESCYLLKSGSALPIGGSYTELGGETNSILFYPESVMNYNTRYTLYITTDVTDLKGNHLQQAHQTSFKTSIGDKKPPTIIGIIPTNGATGVFVSDKIIITFSEAMDKTSVQNSLTVTPAVDGYVWDNENKTLTIGPSPSLLEGKTYTITVSTGAKDMSGNSLAKSTSSSFTTVFAVAPTIFYLEPGRDPLLKTGVTVKTPVVAVFSEPIDPNTITVNSGNYKLLKGDANTGTNVQGHFEFINQNSQVVFRPDADLDFGQTYTIKLTSDITDVSIPHQHLVTPAPVTFTTEFKPSNPEIKFINPPSDVVGAHVIIGGKGFDPNPAKNTVTFFDNIAANVISATLTSIEVEVPFGAKSGKVSVKVNGASEDASSPYDFLVIQAYSDPCNEVTGSAQTGGNSRAVALDFSGAKAYITNSGSNTVSVIDIKTLQATKLPIPVGEFPLMIDINPEGTRAYVTNFGSRTVSVIDMTTDTKIKDINVGINPYGVAVSPDGKRVYVANYGSPDVSVIDADPTSGGFDHVTSNIITGTKNRNLDIDPNGIMLVVAGNDGLKIIEIIKTELGFDYSTTNASSGTQTRDTKIITEAGLAVVSTMDGRLLFIGIEKGTDTFGAVVANSSSGARAGDVKPDFSGVFLYVTNPYDNQVTVYKMSYGGGGSDIGSYRGFSLKEYWTIPVGQSPQGLAINKDNNALFVANEFGDTGTNGSMTAIKICCREKSPSDDIVAVALYIQGLINTGSIKSTDGKMLINKLNDAISNIANGKTKTAVNHLNTFINKVNSLKNTGKIKKELGQKLIDDVNTIIKKLNVSKSDETESEITNNVLDQPVEITETKLGVIYPNPTKEAITINYEIVESDKGSEKVMIQVYDVIGRLVSNVVNKNQTPGRYSVTWNGYSDNGEMASRGFYFIRFSAGNTNQVKRIMLIR